MVEIRLSQEFSKELRKLQKASEEGNGNARYLVKIIERGLYKLERDFEAGQKIQKRLWPRYYINKYGIRILWRLRLDDSWRIIYTVAKEDVPNTVLILEFLNHSKYNRRFGYR